MVGVDGDGSRRRLPSWMLGLANQPQNQKTNKNTCKPPTSTQVVVTHNNNVVTTNKNRSNRGGRRRKDKSVNNDAEEEEEELTVEDLLSIAKEYVEAADAVTDELQSSNPRKKQLLRAESLEKDSKGPRSVEMSPSPTHPTTASFDPTLSSPGATTTTGDPAQDMLNLFLGPLLMKKPLEQEKKMEFADYNEDFSRKLSQRSDAGEEVVAAPVKTKSSLKDKVAMLLD